MLLSQYSLFVCDGAVKKLLKTTSFSRVYIYHNFRFLNYIQMFFKKWICLPLLIYLSEVLCLWVNEPLSWAKATSGTRSPSDVRKVNLIYQIPFGERWIQPAVKLDALDLQCTFIFRYVISLRARLRSIWLTGSSAPLSIYSAVSSLQLSPQGQWPHLNSNSETAVLPASLEGDESTRHLLLNLGRYRAWWGGGVRTAETGQVDGMKPLLSSQTLQFNWSP